MANDKRMIQSVGRSVCVACLKMLENSACFTTGKVLLGARRQLPKRFCSLECMVFAVVVVVVAVVIVVDDRIMKYFVSSFLFLTHLTGEYSADNPPQSNWNCNKNCVWNRRNVLNSIETTRRRWWRWHPMNFPAIFTDRPFAKIQKKPIRIFRCWHCEWHHFIRKKHLQSNGIPNGINAYKNWDR